MDTFISFIEFIMKLIDKHGFVAVILGVLLVLVLMYPFISKDSFIHRMIVGAVLFMLFIIFVVAVHFWILKQKASLDTNQKKTISTIEVNKTDILKEIKFSNNLIKTLSMKESINKFINTFNNKNYTESFEFIKPFVISKKGFPDKDGYVNYWKKNPAKFDFQDLDENRHSFHVMIKFENINYNIIKKYKLEKKNKWFISKELFSTKIENSTIKYEGKDSIALAYIATFNENGAILKSYSRTLYIGKNCDINLIDKNEEGKKYNGTWYQSDSGFIVEVENKKNIIFNKQEMRIASHNCYK